MTQYLEFDGYCPESNLKGEKVRMLLNNMDFWESEKTGLQMTVFPPYAAILQWRGEGKFREQIQFDTTDSSGLFLAMAQRRRGYEIFPDEKHVFESAWDLEEYIHYIDESHSEYVSRAFNHNDPIFNEQQERLAEINKKQVSELTSLFTEAKNDTSSEAFQSFQEKLYDIGIVFKFNWMRWDDGLGFLEDTKSDYTQLPMLKVSMLLTSIFRSDRFSPGTIKMYLENDVVEKLVRRLGT